MDHPLTQLIANMADVFKLGGEPFTAWPDKMQLYQPIEESQILLPDRANCLAVQAFLRMCKLDYEVVQKHNAEEMSPSMQVPVLKCHGFLLSSLETIIQFVEQKDITLTNDLQETEKAELLAYISLVNLILGCAENYITWVDKDLFYNSTRVRFGSVYPWPLDRFLTRKKQKHVFQKLDAHEWLTKTTDEVNSAVEECFEALSNKLEQRYFFGNSPTELDAVVFAHVYTILSNPSLSSFSEILASHHNITSHCERIRSEFFSEFKGLV